MENNLKKIIKKSGVTISHIIKITGISRSAFYEIMNGPAVPSLLNARKICNAVGKTLEQVFPEGQ